MILNHLAIQATAIFGTMGVTIFFVLSGYLITGLLVGDVEMLGTVRLRRFWARRVRRLIPALIVLLWVLVLAGALLAIPEIAPPAGVFGALVFSTNWAWVQHLNVGGLNHTWSLAVEEQFYLLWPIVVLLVTRWARRPRVAVGIVAAALGAVSLTVMFTHVSSWSSERIYAGPDTRAYGLLLGAVLACVPQPRPAPRVVALLVWLPFPFLLGTRPGSPVELAVVAPLAALSGAYVIWQGARARALSSAWIRYVGRRSYALYLWHYPLMLVAAPRLPFPHRWEREVVAIAAAFVAAELSYRLVERRFLAPSKPPATMALDELAVCGP